MVPHSRLVDQILNVRTGVLGSSIFDIDAHLVSADTQVIEVAVHFIHPAPSPPLAVITLVLLRLITSPVSMYGTPLIAV